MSGHGNTRGRAGWFTSFQPLLARAAALLIALSGSGVFVVLAAAPAGAAITAPFNKVFSVNTSGGILIRGNTVLTCQDAATSCASARANSTQNNNSFFDSYIDVDGDVSTFDSSSATVDVPAGGAVLFAALTWGGTTSAGGSLASPAFGTGTGAGAPTAASAGQIKFKTPGAGSYATVASSRTTFLAGVTGAYQGYADVTGLVQAAGNGSYTSANLQTAIGTNIPGGWALTVAYSNPADPPRNLTIFSGFGTVGAGDVVDATVNGFQTPPTGTVKTTLGTVSYEGDAGSVGDQLLLGNTTGTLQNVTDALHPLGNSFVSIISTNGVDSSTRNPKYRNQLGFDASTFAVNSFLANGSSSAVIRMTSAAATGETYYPGVLTFATDLYSPDLDATKSVSIVAKASGNTQAGIAEPGDTLQYSVNATNNGLDASTATVLTDTMPVGTTYSPGSLTSGGTALTDASGDDIGKYTAATKLLTVNVGAGATAGSGGNVAAGASIATVTFRVTVDSSIVDGASIPNTASLTYSGLTTGIAVSGASNAVTTPAVRHHSALAVTKTADLASVQRGSATPVTYLLTVTNAGPYDDPAVTVTDTLPTGAVVVSATPSAGSCATPPGSVICSLGALVNGGTATVSVTVRLDAVSDPASDTAGVAGSNVDSQPGDNTASRSTVVNTAPTASADSATTAGGTVTVAVLANDSDADNDALSVTPGATSPANGSIVVNAAGTITYTATAGAVGADTFSYVVSDGRGGSATASVTVTIPNQPPVAVADSTSTTPKTAVTVNVLANDTDPNIPTSGQALSVSAITQPAGGNGVVTTNGSTVTYTPSVTFLVGTTTFTYTVSDGAGGAATASVTVTIPNVGPIATDDSVATPYLAAVTVDVLGNDTDDNGDPLTVTAVTAASHGVATITGTGINTKVRYTPATGWSGTEFITYTISDGSTTTTGRLTVTTADAPPTAGSFSASVTGGTFTALDVLAHSSDPNADTLTVTGAGPAAHGTVTVDAVGNVVYTPASTYAGPDTFDYSVSDGRGGTATGTVTVTVRNQDPTANNDTAMVPANRFVDVPVLTNDTDGNDDTLAVSIVTLPTQGTATVRPDGTVRYTPAAGYLGDDSFTYAVDDGHGGSDSAQVDITVANQSPVATADSAVAAGAAGSPITIDVLANDTDPNDDPLTIVSISVPAHGTATLVAGQIRYSPDASYAGADSFSYTVSDGRGGLSGATVSVDVQNRAPAAVADALTASSGVVKAVDVLANDTDADSETLSVLSFDATSSQGGAVTLGSGGRLSYTSGTGFTGSDSFSYVVTDPRGGTDTGTVTVSVGNANPVASDRAVTTGTNTPAALDLLSGVTDADGQPVVVLSAGPAAHGTVTVDSTGRATYTPAPGYAGPDTFDYTVSDGQGGTTTATVTVTVSDAAPSAVDDTQSVGYDVIATVDVLANDSDANIPATGQVLAVTSVNVVSGAGGVRITSAGRVEVDPDADFAGDVVVRYVVTDGAGGSSTGQLTVHVAVPAAVAIDDTAATTLNTAVNVDVLANDSSGQAGVAPSIVAGSVTSPVDTAGQTHGAVSIVAGELRYVPAAGFAGTVTFTYSVANPLGGTDTGTVTLTVGNADPVAVDDSTSVAYDTSASVDVIANDSDPNIPGTVQVLGIDSLALTSGRATVTTTGVTITVDPDAGFAGDIVVDYVISDGAGATSTAQLVVHVALPVAVAVADSATTAFGTPVDVDVLANDDSGEAGAAASLVVGSVTDPVDSAGTTRGSVTVVGGQLRYVPPSGFSGTVTFAYTMTNPLGGQDSATVTVTVGNAVPVAVADLADTAYDATTIVDVLANDTDPNIPGTDQALVVTSANVVSGAATVTVTAGGAVSVDPDVGFTGDVVVTYALSDGAGGTAVGGLTVHVALPVAHAVDDAFSTDPGVAVSVDVLANDESGQAGASPLLVAGSVTMPLDSGGVERGTVQEVGGSLRYAPPAGFSGVVTFSYAMANPLGGTDTGLVTVVIGNIAPAAADDVADTSYTVSVSTDVLSNDFDANISTSAQTLRVTDITLLSGQGTVGFTAAGVLTVQPPVDFAGDIVVQYVVSDGAGGTDTGLLTVHVAPPVPSASDDSATTPYHTSVLLDLLTNDHSGQVGAGPTIVAGSVSAPLDGHGVIRGSVIIESGRVRYTPPVGFSGSVVFGYTISNPLGGTDIGTVTVTVGNAAPVAADDAAGTPYATPVNVAVLSNDSDPNIPGSAQILALSSAHVVNGAATVTIGVGGVLRVVPRAGFAGDVVISYTVSDGSGGNSTAVLIVHVAIPLPAAVADRATTAFGHAVIIDVLANDGSGQPGAVANILAGSVTAPVDGTGTTRGAVAVVGGRLWYVPAVGFAGTVTFGYTVANPLGGTDTATVTVTVLPQRVDVQTDEVSITAGEHSVNLDPASVVLGHGALTLVSVTQPAGGATVALLGGRLVVTRVAGFVGTATFSYVVVGADGTQVTVTVNVHVLAAVNATGGGTGGGTTSGGGATASDGGALPRTGADVAAVTLAGLIFVGLGILACWLAGPRRRERSRLA